jgi:hypothetical protein
MVRAVHSSPVTDFPELPFPKTSRIGRCSRRPRVAATGVAAAARRRGGGGWEIAGAVATWATAAVWAVSRNAAICHSAVNALSAEPWLELKLRIRVCGR